MRRPPRWPVAVVVAISAPLIAGCGETYIDTSVTMPPSGVASTTLPPVRADAPLDELLSEMGELMEHLDERIIEDDAAEATMERIEELWDAADPQLRAIDPDALFPYQQALTLARSGVDRNRPADASRGYKLLAAALADGLPPSRY